jgi:hypothetical protein
VGAYFVPTVVIVKVQTVYILRMLAFDTAIMVSLGKSKLLCLRHFCPICVRPSLHAVRWSPENIQAAGSNVGQVSYGNRRMHSSVVG